MASMTLQQMLDDAKDKLHRLLTGTLVVSITDQNGEKLTFNSANAAQLRTYIQDLEAQLGVVTPYHLRARPMRFIF